MLLDDVQWAELRGRSVRRRVHARPGRASPTVTSCSGYACDAGTNLCKLTCAADADCLGGFYCDSAGHCTRRDAQDHGRLRQHGLLHGRRLPAVQDRPGVQHPTGEVPVKRALLIALVAVGCAPETGVMVEVKGTLGGGSTTDVGITKLDFVVAHPSWCERWVGVAPANHTTRDVSGRNLATRPYEFRITPSHTTDLSEQMYVAALAYGANGQLIGEAWFDAHALSQGEVLERSAEIYLFRDTAAGAPQYVASDGACVCAPGEPWVGDGSGAGCDTRVITSFDRLIDTAGCELTPKGAALPVPVCDGQTYMDEPIDRNLPCWNKDDAGACRVTTRHCADHNGIAYAEECNVDGTDTMLPADTALCDRYRTCEQTACGDVIGCVRGMFTQKANIKCTLPIDPTTAPGEAIRPCANGSWSAALPTATTGGTQCLAAMLDGINQPPYHLGLRGGRGDRAALAGGDVPEHAAHRQDRRAVSRGGAQQGVRHGVGRAPGPRDGPGRAPMCRRRALAGMLGDVTTTARGGELLLFGFEGKTAPPELMARIAAGRAMGVILFARNLGTPDEIAALTRALHEAAPADGPPIVVSVDQEGGRVQRVKAPLTVWPAMARVAAVGDLAYTEAVGRAMGAGGRGARLQRRLRAGARRAHQRGQPGHRRSRVRHRRGARRRRRRWRSGAGSSRPACAAAASTSPGTATRPPTRTSSCRASTPTRRGCARSSWCRSPRRPRRACRC